MIIALATLVATQLPLLSPVFGSHMVLQRDKPNPVWGWAKPGAKVRVQLGKVAGEAVASKDGRWMVTLPALSAGGPYQMKVDGPEQKVLDDIWMGEVWLCSGQSNMEFGILQTLNHEEAVAKADRPMIRFFMVDRQVALEPQVTLSGTWKVCSPKTVAENGWGGFSGVAYHFGLELQEKLGVPIGLIQAAWGGTSGEAWTGGEALAHAGEFTKELAMLEAEKQAGAPALGTYVERWIRGHDEGTMAKPEWSSPEFDSSKWEPANLPRQTPENQVFWFRAEFELASDWVPTQAYLHLGEIGGQDVAWINGLQVGGGSGQWERTYSVSATQLKPGKNVLAVRLMYSYGSGGLLAAPDKVYLDMDGKRVALGSTMTCHLGAAINKGEEPRDTEPNPTVPTVLRNGMIAPLAPLAIRGAIWYQGETNMGRGVQYGKILTALISDWRKLFHNPEMSVHVVSLANWLERQKEPVAEYMPEIRETQASSPLKEERCGVAMAYDVGDAIDVHPKDKTTVGHRLALCARALTYGEKIEWSGPIFRKFLKEGAAIRLEFDHANSGLEARGDLKGFAIAGADQKWHWGDARIDGKTVVVTCTEVPDPVAVRYAWQNNPPATLYNRDGLPAIPFRTDRWPLLSENNH